MRKKVVRIRFPHWSIHRYQTAPDDAPKLLKECKQLQQIVNLAQINIDKQVKGYAPSNVSLLYSLPKGKPQGFHQDDYRSDTIVKRDGPLLSVIIALQNDTKLDVKQNNDKRNTYCIPMGSMFVFDGKLMHGCSAYTSHNLRLHLYFKYVGDIEGTKGGDGSEDVKVEPNGVNEIAKVFRCPIEDCDHRRKKINFTDEGINNHWRIHHRKEEKMGLKTYEAAQAGTLKECAVCKKTCFNRERLEYHVWKEHGGPRPVYGCDKCEKTFLKQESLKKHLQKCHGDPTNPEKDRK